jgi:hypothetical protein
MLPHEPSPSARETGSHARPLSRRPVLALLVIALAGCAERGPAPAAPAVEERRPPAEEPRSSPRPPGSGLPEGPVSLRSKHSGRCLEVGHDAAAEPYRGGWSWSKAGQRVFQSKLQKDPGPLLQQWKCTQKIAQRFRMKRQLDGGVALRSAATDFCLDASVMAPEPGLIAQAPCNGSPEQSFRVERAPDGSLSLIAQPSGKCLEAVWAEWPEGALIQQSACTDSDTQRWIVGP